MPAVVVQTWTYPTTPVGTIANQLDACRVNLPISVANKASMLPSVNAIIIDLIIRQAQANHAPYVITVDQTAGVSVNALNADLLQKAAPNLPQEMHDQILHMASPASTRYRILTQDGNGAPQTRTEVFT